MTKEELEKRINLLGEEIEANLGENMMLEDEIENLEEELRKLEEK